MASTNRLINVPANTRVDVADLDALSLYAQESAKRAVRLVAETRTTASDIARTVGCVLRPIVDGDGDHGVLWNTPGAGDVTLLAGTEFVFAAPGYLGGDESPGPWGDVITLAADVILPSALPTGVNVNVILARPSGVFSDDTDTEDTRIRWNSGTSSEESFVNSARGKSRVLETNQFTIRDSVTGAAQIVTDEADGYSRVCQFTSTPAIEWYFALPYMTGTAQATPPANLPGGPIASVVQSVNALANRIAAITGTAWYANPAATISAMNATLTAHGLELIDHEARIQVLETDSADYGMRIDELEDPGYACVAVSAAGQSFACGAAADIDWTAADEYDPRGWHDPGTNPNRITITETGFYAIQARAGVTLSGTPASGTGRLQASVNGSALAGELRNVASCIGTSFSINVLNFKYLSAGDIITVEFEQNFYDSGPAALSAVLAAAGHFSVVKIR